jgi:hypothetical protein
MFTDDGSNPEPDPDYTEYMTGKKNILGNETMPGMSHWCNYNYVIIKCVIKMATTLFLIIDLFKDLRIRIINNARDRKIRILNEVRNSMIRILNEVIDSKMKS